MTCHPSPPTIRSLSSSFTVGRVFGLGSVIQIRQPLFPCLLVSQQVNLHVWGQSFHSDRSRLPSSEAHASSKNSTILELLVRTSLPSSHAQHLHSCLQARLYFSCVKLVVIRNPVAIPPSFRDRASDSSRLARFVLESTRKPRVDLNRKRRHCWH